MQVAVVGGGVVALTHLMKTFAKRCLLVAAVIAVTSFLAAILFSVSVAAF